MFFNTLVPGSCSNWFKVRFFSFMSQIDLLSTSCEIALWCMPRYPIDESTLVQVNAWCHNKPLPESMLTQICVSIWLHYATVCWHLCIHIKYYFCIFAFVHWWHSHSYLIFLEYHQLIPGTVSSNIAKKGTEFNSQLVMFIYLCSFVVYVSFQFFECDQIEILHMALPHGICSNPNPTAVNMAA